MAIYVLKIPDRPAGNRFLSKKEAAQYCRIPVNKFSAVCPVVPTDLGGGYVWYDLEDLVKWIENRKGNAEVKNNIDDLIKRVG